MSDREKCQICNEPILGGHDMVGALLSPYDCFHHWWHLKCYMAAEREAIATLVHDRLGADGHGVAQMIRKRGETEAR